ncbi:MAG TPA: hypothetical protein VIX73_27930 [Kofleriaceae bacterium]|jgi:hypothetical protein
MSKAPRKLTLTRETLLPLQNHELAAVHGGTATAVSRVTIRVSVRACQLVSRISLAGAQAGFTVVPKVVNTAKKVGERFMQPGHPTPYENMRFGPGVTGK